MAGTMRERSPNKWLLEYMYEGERYSQTVRATSPQEASRLLASFVADVDRGNYSHGTKITFVEFAQLFVDKYANDNLSPSTVNVYKHMLNKYILQDFGRMKLASIKRLHIQEFANKLVNEYNLSSKTTSNYIKLMSTILNKAIEWDFLQKNVADKVSIPKNLKKQKKKVVLYSYQEIQKFLNALENCEDKELQMAIYSSFVIGGRRGEILSLNTDNINFEESYVEVTNSKIAVKGGTIIKDTKTGKERKVYVPKSYLDILKKYLNYLGNPGPNTFLFKMHPDTYSSKFKEFLTANNLREINLKDLRALNESILVNRGVDIVAAAKRLGHLPSTATNYYLNQIPEEDKKASEILQNLF